MPANRLTNSQKRPCQPIPSIFSTSSAAGPSWEPHPNSRPEPLPRVLGSMRTSLRIGPLCHPGLICHPLPVGLSSQLGQGRRSVKHGRRPAVACRRRITRVSNLHGGLLTPPRRRRLELPYDAREGTRVSTLNERTYWAAPRIAERPSRAEILAHIPIVSLVPNIYVSGAPAKTDTWQIVGGYTPLTLAIRYGTMLGDNDRRLPCGRKAASWAPG